MTKTEAVAETKILLGKVAAGSKRAGHTEAEFLATLEAMRDAIDHAIELCESCAHDGH